MQTSKPGQARRYVQPALRIFGTCPCGRAQDIFLLPAGGGGWQEDSSGGPFAGRAAAGCGIATVVWLARMGGDFSCCFSVRKVSVTA